MKRTIHTILALGLLGAAVPAPAQGSAFTQPQVELLSEMWALAGVCNQWREYDVQQDALAEFLNGILAGAGQDDYARVSAARDARLADIREEAERVQALPRGASRVHAVQDNAESLMTRCQTLAGNSLASEYYVARR